MEFECSKEAPGTGKMEAEGVVCLVAVSDSALNTGSQKYYALAEKVYISEPHFPTNLHAFFRFGVHNRLAQEQAALHQECTEQIQGMGL